MKTFRQFIEELLEDKRGLTPAQADQILRIRREQGRRAAEAFRQRLQSRAIRNLSPNQQQKALSRLPTQNTRLRPGEFLRHDGEKWVSNLPE